MKALGIISEYNPFHNGHKYQIKSALDITGADVLISVMSGNFMERGEPAIIDKWERAKIAIKEGINLVIELPAIYATQNAGIFSKGGVSILEGLNCDYISFGSEDSIDKLIEIRDFIKENEEEINNLLKLPENLNLSFPRARAKYVSTYLGKEYGNILEKPNNILAIEYLYNIKKMSPVQIDRVGALHDETFNGTYASGKYIRNSLKVGGDVSEFLPYELNYKSYVFKENLFNSLISLAFNSSSDYLNSFFGAEEGLGNIIKNNYRYYKSYDDIVMDLKSKRYTETRIMRTLLNMLLGIRKEDINKAAVYARILAFDEKGRKYLNELKHCESDIKVITNINKVSDESIGDTLKFDIRATDLYNIISNRDLYKNSDFINMPYRF